MQPPKIPINEADRLQALHDLEILDTEPETAFDNITQFVQDLFNTPTVLISLVDSDRQWFKSAIGLSEKETSRTESFCAYAVADGKTLVVEDTLASSRFKDHPAVKNLGIRFYAGALLTVSKSVHLGTLCVFDSKPRNFSAREQGWLETMAKLVTDELQLRFELRNRAAEQQLFANGPVAVIIWDVSPTWPVLFAAQNIYKAIGYTAEQVIDRQFNFLQIVVPEDRALVREVLTDLTRGEKEQWEIDYRVLTPDGDIHWLRQVCRADVDQHGQVLRIRGYLLEQTERKTLEVAVHDANERYTLALDAGDMSTWDWDMIHDRIGFSEGGAELLGYADYSGSFSEWRRLMHPKDISNLDAALSQHYAGETERFEVRFRLRHKEGHWVWLHSVGKLVERTAAGEPRRLVGTHRNITEQVENELERKRQRRILDLLSGIQNDFLLAKDFSVACNNILDVLKSLTGSQLGLIGEVPQRNGKNHVLWLHALRERSKRQLTEEHQNALQSGLEVVVQSEAIADVLVRGKVLISNSPQPDATAPFNPLALPPLESVLAMPILANQQVIGLMVLANSQEEYSRNQLTMLKPVMETLSTLMHTRRIEEERSQALAELKRLATTDELTGVANRRVFIERCDLLVEEAQRYTTPVSLILIDIDHFKQVNDTYGHGGGDQVLQEFTKRVGEQLRDLDLLGRLGGEEFAVVLPHTNLEAALLVAERIREAVASKPMPIGQQLIDLTMSAGIAQFDESDSSSDAWLARADIALYQAKDNGRDRCEPAVRKFT